MLNKKGLTIVEIIISVSLISIVLIFLFSLYTDVQDINYEATVNTDNMISKSLMIKRIEDDFINSQAIKALNSYTENGKKGVKFTFNDNTTATFTLYKTGSKYYMSYLHDRVGETIELKEIAEPTYKCSFKGKDNSFLITFPITGLDNKDYSINISYSGTTATVSSPC